MLYRSPLESIIGDEDNEYYGNAYVVYNMILLVASYSIPSAISKEISQRIAIGQKKNADRVFKCAMAYAFIVASIISYVFADLLFVGHNASMVFRFLAPTIFFWDTWCNERIFSGKKNNESYICFTNYKCSNEYKYGLCINDIYIS